MLSKQEIFDKVAAHLLTQGAKAADTEGCLYRAPQDDGRVLKCAAGCLLPDGLYSPEMEFKGVSHELIAAALLPIVGDKPRLRFLGQLQDIHDWISVAEWPASLADVAEENGLNASVLDQFPPHQA